MSKSNDYPRRASPAGHLIAIGGAEDKSLDSPILSRFVELSGSGDARIVVIPTASEEPEAMREQYERVFGGLGVASVDTLSIATRADANRAEFAERTLSATGIFMTGGNQDRLLKLLGGSDVARAMHRAFREHHACVAGTSAGATALSEHMVVAPTPGVQPFKGMLRLAAGFGFLRRIVIDMHFVERQRLGRLLAVIAENPYLVGLGVDEDTALVVTPGVGVEIIGQGAVTVLDARQMVWSNALDCAEGEALAISDVRLHLLPAGFVHSVDGEIGTGTCAVLGEIVQILSAVA